MSCEMTTGDGLASPYSQTPRYFKSSGQGDAFDSYQELGRFVDKPICPRKIHRTARKSLELHHQNGAANSRERQRVENGEDWTTSNQASNRGRLNDYRKRVECKRIRSGGRRTAMI